MVLATAAVCDSSYASETIVLDNSRCTAVVLLCVAGGGYVAAYVLRELGFNLGPALRAGRTVSLSDKGKASTRPHKGLLTQKL